MNTRFGSVTLRKSIGWNLAPEEKIILFSPGWVHRNPFGHLRVKGSFLYSGINKLSKVNKMHAAVDSFVLHDFVHKDYSCIFPHIWIYFFLNKESETWETIEFWFTSDPFLQICIYNPTTLYPQFVVFIKILLNT